MATTHASSRLTAKGQTILPKALRQRLNIASGALVACNVQQDRATIEVLSAGALQDAMLAPFLTLIQADIEMPAAMNSLQPAPLDWKNAHPVCTDIDLPIAGKVAL
jgi:bifunctional DNA-binding transcriptional regulator/antitoxin component of YhaV-PrlF toxin-antitoxin module